MNTSKQINVMLGLLMVFAVATTLYFVWDNTRADDATARQLMDNSDRGGKLFSLNCRSCHGLTGKGTLENSLLPGAPLNIETNRPVEIGPLAALENRFRDTIHCGRVGTFMPPWSQAQGGSLNDFQIEQIVTLITSAASEEGWKHAQELANEADAFKPVAKHLTKPLAAAGTTVYLNDATAMKPQDRLRIDDDPMDDVYEIVTVVDAPAGTTLNDDIKADQTELGVQFPNVFHVGDLVKVEDEHMRVEQLPTSTMLTADVTAGATTISVASAAGLAADMVIKVEIEKMQITAISGITLSVQRAAQDTEAKEHKSDATVAEDSPIIRVTRGIDGTAPKDHLAKLTVQELGDSITVERASFGTKAADHTEGAEVFAGPLPPANTITGASGTPPCGQKAPAPVATPGPPIAVTGPVDMNAGDNFFQAGGQNNPTLAVKVGQAVTINIKNTGTAIHNARTSGADNTLGNDDDAVSVPDVIPGGESGKLTFTFAAAGSYAYQCDFHPVDMKGQITVTQ